MTNSIPRWGLLAAQIILSLMIAACSSAPTLAPDDAGSTDADDAGSTDVSDAGSTDAGCDPSITYASFGMNFFTTYCNHCHAWDQQQVRLGYGGTIVSVAGTGTYMPPQAPFPTDDERMKLVQWITCGAP